MSNKPKKQLKSQKAFITQDILISLLVILIFIAIISATFIKMADMVFETKKIERTNK